MISPEFTAAHRERLAIELAEDLDEHIDQIGEGKGRIGVCDHEFVFETASEPEMRAVIAGIREQMLTVSAWIGEKFNGSEATDCEQILIRHGVTYEMIKAEFDGAEGELHARRWPGKKPFAKRFRRLQAWLEEIRAVRLSINTEFPAGPRETFNERWDAWTASRDAAADAWLFCKQAVEIDRQVGSYGKYPCHGDEEFAAKNRVNRELKALQYLCFRRRKKANERRREDLNQRLGVAA